MVLRLADNGQAPDSSSADGRNASYMAWLVNTNEER